MFLSQKIIRLTPYLFHIMSLVRRFLGWKNIEHVLSTWGSALLRSIWFRKLNYDSFPMYFTSFKGFLLLSKYDQNVSFVKGNNSLERFSCVSSEENIRTKQNTLISAYFVTPPYTYRLRIAIPRCHIWRRPRLVGTCVRFSSVFLWGSRPGSNETEKWILKGNCVSC